MKTQQKDSQAALTPSAALAMLKEGNERFRNRQMAQRDLLQQDEDTSGGQWPAAVILSCIDSRTSSELIFDQGIGDVFNARIAGNFVNEDILGSMEFACKLAGSKLVVVLGHSHCGAIKGACDGARLGNLTHLIEKLEPVVAATESSGERNSSNAAFVHSAAINNVKHAITEIRRQSHHR